MDRIYFRLNCLQTFSAFLALLKKTTLPLLWSVIIECICYAAAFSVISIWDRRSNEIWSYTSWGWDLIELASLPRSPSSPYTALCTIHYTALSTLHCTALRCPNTLDLPHRIGLFVHPCNLYVQEVQEADRGQPQPHPHQKFHYVPIYVSKHLKALPSSLLKILTVQIVCCSGLCTCTYMYLLYQNYSGMCTF